MNNQEQLLIPFLKPQYWWTVDISALSVLTLMFQSSSQQEAHKMVHEANVKQAAAEKQLKEAQGKVCFSTPVKTLADASFVPLKFLHGT